MEHQSLDDLVAEIRARLPDSATVLDRIAQEVIDDGLGADVVGHFQVEEYSQHLMESARTGRPGARAAWRSWTTLLEGWFGRTDELDDALRWLVVVFLPRPDNDTAALLDGLGPATRHQLDVVQSELEIDPPPEQVSAFLRDLVAAHPELDDLASEWSEDGVVVVTYSFMADVARHVLAEHDRGGEHAARAHEILHRVEDALAQGDQDLHNLLALGFVEGFPEQDAPRPDLVAHFGPHLMAEAHNFAPDLFEPT